MNDSIVNPGSQRRRRGLLLLILLAAAVVAFFGICWWWVRGGVTAASPAVGGTPANDTAAFAVSNDSRPVLRVAIGAMISPKPTAHHYDDLLRLIGDSVGRRVEFVQRKTYAEVNDLLEREEIDLAFVCSGPYVLGHEKFGMEILAVPVAHGESVYYSYFIVNRDSPAKTLDDLKGKTFAFTDPGSNTGCLVPKYVLAQRGQTPSSFFSSTFFTHSHDNSIKAVAEGLADGAAVDSLIWDFLQATDPVYTQKTKVIVKSPPYGIPPVVVHPRLDESLKRALRGVVLSLHEREASGRLLNQLQIDRFMEGNDTMYDSVRRMQRWLADHERQQP